MVEWQCWKVEENSLLSATISSHMINAWWNCDQSAISFTESEYIKKFVSIRILPIIKKYPCNSPSDYSNPVGLFFVNGPSAMHARVQCDHVGEGRGGIMIIPSFTIKFGQISSGIDLG
jgi:hypothetical protein